MMEEEIRREIAHKTASRRKALGLSMERVSRRIGVSKSQYHRYETGENSIAAEKIPVLADILGVSPLFFMTTPIEQSMHGVPFRKKEKCLSLIACFLKINKCEHEEWLLRQAQLLSELR